MNLAEKCHAMAEEYWFQEYNKINLLFQQSLFVNKSQCIKALENFVQDVAEKGGYRAEFKKGIHRLSKTRELEGFEDIAGNLFDFVDNVNKEKLCMYARSKFEKWLVSELTNFVEEFTKLTGIDTSFEITAFEKCTTFSYYLRFSWA